MNRLNQLLPEVLLAYVTNVDCVLSPEKCNELSKLVSQLETKNEMLLQERLRETTRVRCTADGEFPAHGEMVIFEVDGDDAWIGGCESYDLDCGSFWFGADDDEADFHPITEPIYWKQFGNLKAQYERERWKE